MFCRLPIRTSRHLLALTVLVMTMFFFPAAGRTAYAATPDAAVAGERSDAELNAAGFSAYQEKRYAEAARLFRLAIDKNPSVKIYYNNEGAALMNLGRYEEAYRALALAIALDPGFCRALSNMAVTCFYLGRYREAYQYYSRAREADGAYTAERFERGRVTEKLREFRKQHPEKRDLDGIFERMKGGMDVEAPGL
jgi:Flp pilus assembly protein TadD